MVTKLKSYKNNHKGKGFTIVELMVVLSVIALLLSIITPRYLNKINEGQEAALKQNLSTIRHSLDQYHSDQGDYPSELDDLVEKRYLREIPLDPIMNDREWKTILDKNSGFGIYDIKSRSDEMGSDKRPYSEW